MSLRLWPFLAWLLVSASVLGACGSASDLALVVASSPPGIGVGDQRVLVTVVDGQTGNFVSSPDVQVDVTLRNQDGSPIERVPGRFLWAVPETSGVYAAVVAFPEAGTYQLTLQSELWGELGPVGVVALQDPTVVEVGEVAPRSDSRILANSTISDLTSDPDPDPRLYEITIADAVEPGPAVIVFASFVSCPEGECGTLLDQVKGLISEFPTIRFVHTDVYEDVTGADVEAVLVDAVGEWGIPSEPWVFVVDADGLISDRFEGAVSTDVLRTAMAAVTTVENTDK